MDWNTVLSTIAIIVFVVLMMRGCGGMMAGGGCGMGRPRRREHDKSTENSASPHAGRT